MKWHEEPWVALDTETTSVDPLTARIVTAAVVTLVPGRRPQPVEWLIDPGVEIPAEASAVHGWTSERLAATIKRPGHALRKVNGHVERIPRDAALFEIAGKVALPIGQNVPLVVHNAAYDLTLLETELTRHDIDTLTARPAGIAGVVDPMVIERAYDTYRKTCYKAPGCRPDEKHHECSGCRGGKHRCGGCGVHDRTLASLCTHYGVVHGGAHGASTDAVAAARLLKKVAGLWPQLGTWKLSTLHANQISWRKEQSDSLRDFWQRKGNEAWREVDSGWPLHSALAEMAVARV